MHLVDNRWHIIFAWNCFNIKSTTKYLHSGESWPLQITPLSLLGFNVDSILQMCSHMEKPADRKVTHKKQESHRRILLYLSTCIPIQTYKSAALKGIWKSCPKMSTWYQQSCNKNGCRNQDVNYDLFIHEHSKRLIFISMLLVSWSFISRRSTHICTTR